MLQGLLDMGMILQRKILSAESKLDGFDCSANDELGLNEFIFFIGMVGVWYLLFVWCF